MHVLELTIHTQIPCMHAYPATAVPRPCIYLHKINNVCNNLLACVVIKVGYA